MHTVKKVMVSKSSIFYPKIKEWWKIFDSNGEPLFAAYLNESEAQKYCQKINLTISS